MPGEGNAPVSHISQAYPDRVEVRGRDLTGELMGSLTFTEYFHLLLTGHEPTDDQRYFLDLLLVAIAEHGMMPTNVAARMTLAADPGSLQGAVAAGILGAGRCILGTSEECARLLEQDDPVAQVHAIRAAGGKVPGFGHPVHKPLDPRAERILELADERGVSGTHVALARQVRDAVAEAWGRPLTMNVAMPIAAVMLDLGFPGRRVKAVPILARTASLLAHLAEERELPLGFHMAAAAEHSIEYRPMSDDDAAYREQIAYLLERSPFYRDKLAGHDIGGLDDIGRLPLTDKREIRATVTPENPFGTHLCADAGGDRPHLLHERHDRHAELHPAHRGRPRELGHRLGAQLRGLRHPGRASGSSARYNAGPFAAGAALAAFDRLGLCHIPVGTGNTDRLLKAIELLRPEAVVMTPSYAAYLVERDFDRSSVERVLVAGEPGGGEPEFRAKLEAGWGARVTEAMGIGDIGVSLWGECEQQDGMHLGAHGFVHPELIDPETGEAVAMEDGATGELVLTHLRHRAAPLLRFRTRDHVRVRTTPVPVRPHRPAHPLPRPHRRHADRARRQRLPLRRPRGGQRLRSRGQRPHPRQAGARRRQAGAAAAGERRAGARTRRPTPRSPSRSASGCVACSSCRLASSWSRGARCSAASTNRKLVER